MSGSGVTQSLMDGANLSGMREQHGESSGNDLVTVTDWQICVGMNGLIESCTVTPTDPTHSITGIGLLLYSADGETLYCSQYTDAFKGTSVMASVSVGKTDLEAGTSVLAVVFGYVEKVRFFYEEKKTVDKCQQ